MSEKKYNFMTIFTYVWVLLSPRAFLYVFQADSSQIIQITTLVCFAGTVVMIFYHVKLKTFGWDTKQKSVLIAVLMGILGIPISLLLQLVIIQIEQCFLGQTTTSQNTQNIIQLIMDNKIFLLAIIISYPIMEEFIFRFVIFGSLQKRLGFFIPALLSSVLFAFAHNDTHYLLYTGLGFLFCLVYRHSGRIWTPMITHVGMNLFVILTQLTTHS